MSDLRGGVEEHWWPRLIDSQLEVEIERDGVRSEQPHPRGRQHLKRFVRGWDLLRGAPPVEGRDDVTALKYKSHKLGVFAMTTGSDADAEEMGDSNSPQTARIALVRAPRMVVEYLSGPALGSAQPLCDGVFLADGSLNAVFAASEPPAHNKWDARTIRQDRPLTEEQKSIIENTIDKIKRAARAFVLERQSPPLKPPARCRDLERMLGKYIRIGPEPPPPPPPGSSPISIRFLEPAQRVGGVSGVTLDAKVRVTLREDPELPLENLVRVRAWVNTILDDGASASERLTMDYVAAKNADGSETLGALDDRGSYVDVVLSPGDGGADVDLRSAVLPHAEYRASLNVTAEVLS